MKKQIARFFQELPVIVIMAILLIFAQENTSRMSSDVQTIVAFVIIAYASFYFLRDMLRKRTVVVILATLCVIMTSGYALTKVMPAGATLFGYDVRYPVSTVAAQVGWWLFVSLGGAILIAITEFIAGQIMKVRQPKPKKADKPKAPAKKARTRADVKAAAAAK